MTGTGRAIVNTPANAHKAPTNIPIYVFGAMSPIHQNKTTKSSTKCVDKSGWKSSNYCLILFNLYFVKALGYFEFIRLPKKNAVFFPFILGWKTKL